MIILKSVCGNPPVCEDGYRGSGPLDEAALITALGALARLALELHEVIDSVDINPLVVMPQGQGAVALDGLIVLQGCER